MSNPKRINWEQVDAMLIAGCNGVECAATIGIHPETLYDKCKEEKLTGWSDYSQSKRAHGDGLLRAAQYQKAYKDKHPTMLIWLGKQRLGQKEYLEDTVNKDIEKRFDDKMNQVLSLLGTEVQLESLPDSESNLNIEESNINSEIKS